MYTRKYTRFVCGIIDLSLGNIFFASCLQPIVSFIDLKQSYDFQVGQLKQVQF